MGNNIITLYEGDCLELMKHIPDKSIDAIITDPPYGTTACKWDSVIDFKLMWEQLNRIIKPNGAIVLFGSEPFSSALRMSNIKNYKYDWIWEKQQGSGSLNCNRRPLKKTESIMVFNSKIYNPQGLIKSGRIKKKAKTEIYGDSKLVYVEKNKNYPVELLRFNTDVYSKKQHATQKPVALMEYLIKTYTNENETVLDFTMGSGSSGVACVNTKRNFIGIEMDDNYFKIAKKRIDDAKQQEKEKLKNSL
jgi:site-specific DNA-methyltransferase (adenine-specific)